MTRVAKKTASRRPAETTAALGALALVIARACGVKDPDTLTTIGVGVGSLPAIVTGIVEATRRKK